MPKSADQISFDLKPLKEREAWYVVATYSSGEHIPGFRSVAEAAEWLAKDK
jgi:hypothetical protein